MAWWTFFLVEKNLHFFAPTLPRAPAASPDMEPCEPQLFQGRNETVMCEIKNDVPMTEIRNRSYTRRRKKWSYFTLKIVIFHKIHPSLKNQTTHKPSKNFILYLLLFFLQGAECQRVFTAGAEHWHKNKNLNSISSHSWGAAVLWFYGRQQCLFGETDGE